jgi:ankyrin repeat protein
LFFFFSTDNPELLAPLLDYADDLEIRDDLGWTPLMTAVNRGSKQNINMLLARGAKIDCDWSGGMSLIADAMNFNDIGKINRFQLRNHILLLFCIFRSFDGFD